MAGGQRNMVDRLLAKKVQSSPLKEKKPSTDGKIDQFTRTIVAQSLEDAVAVVDEERTPKATTPSIDAESKPKLTTPTVETENAIKQPASPVEEERVPTNKQVEFNSDKPTSVSVFRTRIIQKPEDLPPGLIPCPQLKFDTSLEHAMLPARNTDDESTRITLLTVADSAFQDHIAKYITQWQQEGYEVRRTFVTSSVIESVVEESVKASVSTTALVNKFRELVRSAVKSKASDIHIEFRGTQVHLKFRIDGVLTPVNYEMGYKATTEMISALYYGEHTKETNTTFSEGSHGSSTQRYELTDSITVEVRHQQIAGAKMKDKHVFRLAVITNNESQYVPFEQFGYDPSSQVGELISGLTREDGLVVITGPTGSGKTTTTYNALYLINHYYSGGRAIYSAEDPIEKPLGFVQQIPLNTNGKTESEKRVMFSQVKDSLMRGDPDIIFMGEIRDIETAQFAVQMATTGHLVIATAHTNDSHGVISRLVDLGLTKERVLTSLSMVIANRLVKKLCPQCKINLSDYQQKYQNNESDVSEVDLIMYRQVMAFMDRFIDSEQLDSLCFHGNGCEHCKSPSSKGTGYKGRTVVSEVLTCDNKWVTHMHQSKNEAYNHWLQSGGTTIRMHAIKKILSGELSIEDVVSMGGDA